MSVHKLSLPPLYPILDAEFAARKGHDLVRVAAGFTALGLDFQQLRAKKLPSGEYLALADRLVLVVPRLIVNDRADIARICAAAGVHVGQDDLPPETARRLLSPGAIVGLSTHNLGQLRNDADYLAIGPIYATSSKENPDPVVGLEGLRAVRATYSGTLVAIGGIGLEQSVDVWKAGADSIAVISALWNEADPVEAARQFLLAFKSLPPYISPQTPADSGGNLHG